jgi:hypothetical protein
MRRRRPIRRNEGVREVNAELANEAAEAEVLDAAIGSILKPRGRLGARMSGSMLDWTIPGTNRFSDCLQGGV